VSSAAEKEVCAYENPKVGCNRLWADGQRHCPDMHSIRIQYFKSEHDQDLLPKGLAAIVASLDRSVKKEKMTRQENDTILVRITGTTNTEDFHDCDLVIEAIVGELDSKK